MNNQEVIAAVRAIANELSCRGARQGEIGAGTRHRIAKLFNPPRPLATWFNNELETTSTGQRLPTANGEIVKAIISQLMRVYGVAMDRHTVLENEQAIAETAAALPALCDRIEALVTVDIPLGENDVAILSEMLAMGADESSPITRPELIKRLTWGTESKRAMEKLKKFGYVKSAGKLGFYITEAGKKRAKTLG